MPDSYTFSDQLKAFDAPLNGKVNLSLQGFNVAAYQTLGKLIEGILLNRSRGNSSVLSFVRCLTRQQFTSEELREGNAPRVLIDALSMPSFVKEYEDRFLQRFQGILLLQELQEREKKGL